MQALLVGKLQMQEQVELLVQVHIGAISSPKREEVGGERRGGVAFWRIKPFFNDASV